MPKYAISIGEWPNPPDPLYWPIVEDTLEKIMVYFVFIILNQPATLCSVGQQHPTVEWSRGIIFTEGCVLPKCGVK